MQVLSLIPTVICFYVLLLCFDYSFSFTLDGSEPYMVSLGNRKGYLLEKASINCGIEEYGACDNAYTLFPIAAVMQQDMMELGNGLKISEPVKVDMNLRTEGVYFISSLSHNGILAICSFNGTMEEYSKYFYALGCKKFILQLTNLATGEQVEVEVEDLTNVAFYDDKMIVLTQNQEMREAIVEDVFRNPDKSVFTIITRHNVSSEAETTLVHQTRVLYYVDMEGIFHSFNVDTREDRLVETGKNVRKIPSLTGIDMEVKVIFQGDDKIKYALNNDDTITKLPDEAYSPDLIFPSSTTPKDLSKCAFKDLLFIIYNGKKTLPTTPIQFEANNSVVRVYKDVFLLYDMNIKSWVLSRITITNPPPRVRDMEWTHSEYKAFEGVEKVVNLKKVKRQELVPLGDILISEPIQTNMNPRTQGIYHMVSLSHNGILAIYSFDGTYEEWKRYSYKAGDKKNIVQLTNLLTKRQVEVEVEHGTYCAFYDNMIIMLTDGKPIREASVDDVFTNPVIDTFRPIPSTNTTCVAEVTRVNETRRLYHKGTDFKLYEYNVDTKEDTPLGIDKRVRWIASFTGIDMGVKVVFTEWDTNNSYIVDNDNTLTQIEKGVKGKFITDIMPSSTNPWDINTALFKCGDILKHRGKTIAPNDVINLDYGYSLVRLYRDIFLLYNWNTMTWVLSRIVVP